MSLEHAPGAKPLVCIGLQTKFTSTARETKKQDQTASKPLSL